MALTKVTKRMINDEVINVVDYGAFKDETNPTATTAAISAALTDAISQKKSLFFPAGQYSINDEFTINTGAFYSLKIFGEMPGSLNSTGTTIIQTDNTKNIFIFGDGVTSITDIIIDGIEFYGPDSGTGSGIIFKKTSTAKVSNCGFWKFGYYGIYFSGDVSNPNYDIEIVNCRFTQINTSCINSDTNAVNIVTIRDCNLQNDDRTENKHGIQLSGYVINIYGNTIQTLSDGIRIDEGYNINIENNYMENFGGYMLRLGYTNDVTALKLKGNHMYNGLSAGNHLVFQYGNNIYGAELSLNTMWAATGKNKYHFGNAVVFSNVLVLPSRQDDPSQEYVWPTGVYPSYVGDFFSSKVQSKSLSADLAITDSDGNVFHLDPNGANRNISFSGNFPIGYRLSVTNTGSSVYNLIATSFGSYVIPKNTTVTFEYFSGGWGISCVVGTTTNTAISTGTLTIKSLSATSANMTGFIEIQPGIWVPYITNPSP